MLSNPYKNFLSFHRLRFPLCWSFLSHHMLKPTHLNSSRKYHIGNKAMNILFLHQDMIITDFRNTSEISGIRVTVKHLKMFANHDFSFL